MKFKILMLAAFIPAIASAQTAKFTITGKIGTLDKPAKVYLDYMDDGKGNEDSVDVVNGTFKITGDVNGIASARMSLEHLGKGKPHSIYAPNADVMYFYFDKAGMLIESKDSLSNAKVTGSKIYDEHIAYNKAIGGSIMELTKMYQSEYNNASPEDKKDNAFMEALNAKQQGLRNKRAEKQLEFAKANPNSYFALVALSEFGGSKKDIPTIVPLFNALKKELKATDTGKELAQRIKAASITSVGDAAPEFTQNNLNDKPVSLADLKGKVVLLDFWASWCTPCRAENPNMLKQYKLYKDKGFEILSVSLDNVKKNWQQAVTQDGMTWMHVSDLKGWNNAVGRLYGVRAVPTCYLIGRDGKIIATDVRGESLNTKLAEIFNN